MSLQLSDIPVLQRSHVKMKNSDIVLEKIQSIISGKSERLQVVTDFDFTLTKQHIDGKPTNSSFGMISRWDKLPPGFLDKDNELKKKYQAIEFDLNLTIEEKTPYMEEWYSIVEENWKGLSFEFEALRNLIAEQKPQLRDGTLELYKLLQTNQIPCLVCSAGLGDVLTEVLRYHGIVENEYWYVMSNFFVFQNNIIVGYACRETGSFVHPFNKTCVNSSEAFKKKTETRPNIIILGDTLADSQMAKGLPSVKTILKIGYLYGTPEMMARSLTKYLDSFDIVLMDDQTMDVIRTIIEYVIQS